MLLMLATQAVTDPVAATEIWMSSISPEEASRSNAYFEGGYWLILWNFLIGLLIAVLLLSGRRSARFKGMLAAKTPNWLVTPLYVAGYILVTSALMLPMTVYQRFWRETQYGLMNQNFSEWFGEQMISLGISLLMATLALWALYVLIRKLGPAWRWWGAGAAIGFIALMMMVAPVYISPLFNNYTPMEEGKLRTEILAMAEANGVPAENIYVFNISKQSNRVTANVSGFLGTTRISLSDTLLQRASPEGIKAVMGHEIGHYALGHIYEMLVQFGLVIFLGFAFTHWGYHWAQKRWGEKWGIGTIGDIAGLPLFLAVLSVFFFVITPVTNTVIRSNEIEADIFGLNAAAEPDGFASVAMMLAEYRKIHPKPLEEFLFFDHPSGYNRVLMAMKWKKAKGDINEPPASSD